MGVYCDMELENPNLVYLPGDVVAGRIILKLDERELIKAVAIKITGFAFTRWDKPTKEKKQKKQKSEDEQPNQKNNKNNAKPREVYVNREDYLSTTNYFMGSDAASAKIVDTGVYHYNFAVRLPLHCPSVFESNFGHIRYELDVFIDYPEHRQSCYLRNIHVSRPFDLRSTVGLNQPLDIEIIEKKSMLKFWQRPLQLHLQIPQSGFIPGEMISVHLKVLNYDLLTLTGITYKLNLVATLVGMLKNKAKMQISRSNVVKTVHSLFGQNGSVVQHLQNIHVPDTPPTLGIADCRCIQISYEIEVEVETSAKNRGINAVLPITIGTISLSNSVETMQPRLTGSVTALTASRSMENLLEAKAEQSNSFAIASAPIEDGNPEFEQRNSLVAATSFREATFMSSSNLNKRRKHSRSVEQLDNFTPKYVYYDIPIEAQQNDGTPVEQTEPCYGVVNKERTRF